MTRLQGEALAVKLLGVLIAGVVLIGCSGSLVSGVPTDQSNQVGIPARDDFALAGVSLGDTPASVQTVLGDPATVSILHGLGLPLWLYPDSGLEVVFLGWSECRSKSYGFRWFAV